MSNNSEKSNSAFNLTASNSASNAETTGKNTNESGTVRSLPAGKGAQGGQRADSLQTPSDVGGKSLSEMNGIQMMSADFGLGADGEPLPFDDDNFQPELSLVSQKDRQTEALTDSSSSVASDSIELPESNELDSNGAAEKRKSAATAYPHPSLLSGIDPLEETVEKSGTGQYSEHSASNSANTEGNSGQGKNVRIVKDILVSDGIRMPMSKFNALIKTQINRPFSQPVLEEDKRRLMQTNQFVTVNVSTTNVPNEPDKVIVNFDVTNRPLMRFVKIIGNRQFKKSELLKTLGMKAGETPLDPIAVREGQQRLIAYYEQKNFNSAHVEIMMGDRPGDIGVVYLIDEGKRQRVFRTIFEGNTVVSSSRLKTQIQSKSSLMSKTGYILGPNFLWGLFQKDFKRQNLDDDVSALLDYYRKLGYLDAQIDRDFIEEPGFGSANDGVWFTVKFVIQEGMQYHIRNIYFEGTQKLSEAELRDEMKVETGDRYSNDALSRDISKMETLYGKRGYVLAKIQMREIYTEEPGKVDIKLTVNEDYRYRVNEIQTRFVGNESRTQAKVILNNLEGIEPGKILNGTSMKLSEDALKRSGYFENDPSLGPAPQILIEPLDKIYTDEQGNERFEYAETSEEQRSLEQGDENLENKAEKPQNARQSNESLIRGQRQIPTAVGTYSNGNNVYSNNDSNNNYSNNNYANQNNTNQNYTNQNYTNQNYAGRNVVGISVYGNNQQNFGQQNIGQQNFGEQNTGVSAFSEDSSLRLASSSSSMFSDSAFSGSASSDSGSLGSGSLGVASSTSAPMITRGAYPATQGSQLGSTVPNGTLYGTSSRSYNSSADIGSGNGLSGVSDSYSDSYLDDNSDGNSGNSLGSNSGSNSGSVYGNNSFNNSGTGFENNSGNAAMEPAPGFNSGVSAADSIFLSPEQQYFGQQEGKPSVPDPIRDANIIAQVQEARTGLFQASVGVNSNSGLVGNVSYTERNFDLLRFPSSLFRADGWKDAFRGAGQIFRVEAVPGTELQRYSVSWDVPYVFNSKNAFGVNGMYFSRSYDEWFETRVGGGVSLSRRFTPRFDSGVSFSGYRVKISDPITRNVPDLNEALGSHNLFTVGLNANYDTRNHPYLPTRGFRISGNAEQVFGDYNFPRLSYEFSSYHNVHERLDGSGVWVLGFSSNAGWSGSDTPIFERYYGGGLGSLRGFAYRGITPRYNGVGIGGNFEFYNSLELLIPLNGSDSFSFVTFVDTGVVASKINNWGKYRVAPGFGFRVSIPMLGPAPLAFDFAFPIIEDREDDEEVFSFGVGVAR